jgi:hypothetical protein
MILSLQRYDKNVSSLCWAGVISTIQSVLYLLCFSGINFLPAQNGSLQDSTFSSTLTQLTFDLNPLPVYFPGKIQTLSLKLNYPANDPSYFRNYYQLRNVIPADPFKLDYRISSYYTPSLVRDEITNFMDRPSDRCFIPIMGMALFAARLAADYLIIQEKIKINADNIIHSIDAIDILKELWRKNPQTMPDIYEISNIRRKYTFTELDKNVNLLIDNKLIKEKTIEKNQTQFFPAKSKEELIAVIESMLADEQYTEKIRQQLLLILNLVR